jgi:enoyl-CoA hydratase
MAYSTLITGLENGILTVTINRPEKMNALNREVFNDLDRVMDEITDSPAIQSAIITGAGAKAFVAGADISELTALSCEQAMAVSKRGQDVFFKIEQSRKPVVAAVNGFALGGGCELAMACHFRIASETARFGQPEVNLGLIPGYGATQRLVQLIGKGRAIELLITGNMIDAATALQYGLVNQVVPADQLLEKTKSLLLTAGSKAPLAIGACIEAANLAEQLLLEKGFQKEVELFGRCFDTADMKEGTSAFLEKRKAAFKGN